MATPRKRFGAIETTLLREHWPDTIKLTLVLLVLHMNDRWAAEKLTARQAIRCRLSPGDALNVTSAASLGEARSRLQDLSKLVTMTVKSFGNWTEIRWKKLAITQGWEEIDRRVNSARYGKDSGHNARATTLATPEQPPLDRPLSSSSSSEEEEKKHELDPSKTQDLDAAESASPAGQAAPDWKPLLNLLSKLPGDEAEKLAFLADTGPQIEVDAASYGKPLPSLTISYYRRYLAGERRFEHAAEEAIKAAKRKAWHAEHGADYEAHLRATGGVA